jgi:creatinine amidohydrolase
MDEVSSGDGSAPHRLASAAWPDVAAGRFDVAVLPWGATEAHNRHLPYGTDTMQAEAVAEAAARIASEAGARVIALPALPFGVNTGQLDIPLCLNMMPSTQAAVLRDIVRSVEAAGVGKLVLANGHGGNDFRQMIRELQPETRVFLCTLNWYAVVDPREWFDQPGDHAGELETSMMLHLRPELVRLDRAGPGAARQFRLAGLREGWAWAPRQWTRVTDDTGVGDPRAATAEKGRAYFDAVTRKIASFLVELAAADRERMYE